MREISHSFVTCESVWHRKSVRDLCRLASPFDQGLLTRRAVSKQSTQENAHWQLNNYEIRTITVLNVFLTISPSKSIYENTRKWALFRNNTNTIRMHSSRAPIWVVIPLGFVRQIKIWKFSTFRKTLTLFQWQSIFKMLWRCESAILTVKEDIDLSHAITSSNRLTNWEHKRKRNGFSPRLCSTHASCSLLFVQSVLLFVRLARPGKIRQTGRWTKTRKKNQAAEKRDKMTRDMVMRWVVFEIACISYLNALQMP